MMESAPNENVSSKTMHKARATAIKAGVPSQNLPTGAAKALRAISECCAWSARVPDANAGGDRLWRLRLTVLTGTDASAARARDRYAPHEFCGRFKNTAGDLVLARTWQSLSGALASEPRG